MKIASTLAGQTRSARRNVSIVFVLLVASAVALRAAMVLAFVDEQSVDAPSQPEPVFQPQSLEVEPAPVLLAEPVQQPSGSRGPVKKDEPAYEDMIDSVDVVAPPTEIPPDYRVVTIQVRRTPVALKLLQPGVRLKIFGTPKSAGNDESSSESARQVLLANATVFAVEASDVGSNDPFDPGSFQVSIMMPLTDSQRVAQFGVGLAHAVRTIEGRSEICIVPFRKEKQEDVAPLAGMWKHYSTKNISSGSASGTYGGDFGMGMGMEDEMMATDPFGDPNQMKSRFVQDRVFIRDGVLHRFDDETELKLEPVNAFTWRVTHGPVDDVYETHVKRLGAVVRLESVSPSGVVIQEFRKVLPRRDELLSQLFDFTAQLGGYSGSLKDQAAIALQKRIDSIKTELERVDRLPDVDALRLDALSAREKGDHVKAAKSEAEASSLAAQLAGANSDPLSNPFGGELEFGSEDSGYEGESFDPFSSAGAMDAMDMMGAGESLQEPLPSEQDMKLIAEQLQRVQRQSIVQFQRLLELSSEGDESSDAVTEAERQLRSLVSEEFDLRWKLEGMKLRKSRSELFRLEEKHRRRRQLAPQIVERRLKEIRDADETKWNPSRGGSDDMFSGDPPKTTKPDLKELQKLIAELFPEDDIDVIKLTDSSVLLRGTVDVEKVDHILQIVEEFYPSVLNQLDEQWPEDDPVAPPQAVLPENIGALPTY